MSDKTPISDGDLCRRSSWQENQARHERVKQYLADNPFLKSILDSLLEIIIILDENRQAIYANKALLAFLGVEDEKSVMGQRPGEILHCVHASECDRGCGTTRFCKTCGALTAILAAQSGRQDIQECNIIRKRGGGAVNLSVTTTPLVIGGEKVVLFAMLDITNQKRLRELEKIFFHDILNLTTVIWVSADSLRVGHLEKSREYGEKIYNAVRRLVDEIKSYKDLLQAENQELEVNPQLIHSFDLLKQISMLYENHVVARNKVIVIDPASENISFTSDPVLIQRILENMLKNSLEASQEYQKVVLGSRKVDDAIEFWVHNDGNMPDDVQSNIFKRAFSTKEKHRGLGTYSMKLLSENYLEGAVTFESTKEKGTTFVARYPLTLTE